MRYVRDNVRPLLLLACVALFAASGCVVPPVAFHDGLPAWTPAAGQPEASIGYHRMYWYNSGQYQGSAWYLTPGGRVGLAEPPLVADIGLTSVVVESYGDVGAMLGPTLGIGYQNRDVSVVVRPSAYMLGISGGEVRFEPDDPFWQISLLAGNSYQAGQVHFSGGGRIGRLGIGPVLLVGHNLGQVDLRLEGSYMFPRTSETEGEVLSVGLTIGGPVPENEEESGLGDFK